MSDNKKSVTKTFAGYNLRLNSGDRSKKKLSNSFQIQVPNDRTDTTIRMTIREAQSLRNFLNQHLS